MSDNIMGKKCYIKVYMDICALSAHLLLFWDLGKPHYGTVTASEFVRQDSVVNVRPLRPTWA